MSLLAQQELCTLEFIVEWIEEEGDVEEMRKVLYQNCQMKRIKLVFINYSGTSFNFHTIWQPQKVTFDQDKKRHQLLILKESLRRPQKQTFFSFLY
jgi:hypothetical protein